MVEEIKAPEPSHTVLLSLPAALLNYKAMYLVQEASLHTPLTHIMMTAVKLLIPVELVRLELGVGVKSQSL